MNDWDPRRSTDDDYIDPEDTHTAGAPDAPQTPPAVNVPPPVQADDAAPAPSTTPGLFTAPSHDELFTEHRDPAPDEPPAPAYVPPPNDALFRRSPRRAPTPAPAPAAPTVGRKTDPAAPARDRKTAKIAGVLAGVIVLAGAGAIFWVANAFDDDTTNLADNFPAPTTTTAPVTTSTAPAAPPFCSDPDPGDNIVITNAAGDRSSGVGVITAFEYHYYVDRDAGKVVTTYDPALQMDPAGIQPFIDGVAPGTKHCMTITPTGKPDEFHVAGELRSPNSARTEPVDPLIMTTAPGPDGWMITAIVDPAVPQI
ncbi:hypothetical protein [Rhodococcus sp. (in: high G+C Gram-positive bacteria)]|uniref:hypothetical protein n=1 Tax=Rhodococcus sp. TaxID=1831 RepID=UPI003B8A61BE